jgi:WD40 repeat protein
MPELQPKSLKPLCEFPFEGPWPTSVAFVGDEVLAAGNAEGQLYLWKLPEAGQKDAPRWPFRCLQGHTNAITRLLATPDGKTLLSSSLDRTIRLWDPAGAVTGSIEVVLDAETREREAKRGKKDAAAAPGVKVEKLEAAQVLGEHQEWIRAMGLAADGRRLITGDDGANVIVWDVSSGHREAPRVVSRWKGYPWAWTVSAALSPDGKTALVSEYRYKRDDFDVPSPALRLWGVDAGKVKLDLLKIQFPKYDPNATSYGAAQVWRKFVADGLIASAFSPDGKLIACGQGGETDTGQVHLLDAATGKLLRTVSGHRYGVTDVAFSADGKYLLSCGRDTTVRITQLADGKEVAALGQPRGGQFKDWLHALTVSPSQTTVAAADIAGKVVVWRS